MSGAAGGFLGNVLAMAYREGSVMRHDRAFLGAVIAQPVMMLLLMGLVLSNEPANVPWLVLDRVPSPASRALVRDVLSTGYFLAPRRVASARDGEDLLARGEALALLVVPEEFGRDVHRGGAEVQVLLDGADPLSAARVGAILRATASAFDPTRRALAPRGRASPSPAARAVDLRGRFWFNATLEDRDFFLAALAGMLLTNLCLSVTSLGLVGERESGTYEQTLALPTRPLEMVIGKLLPYVGVSYVVLAVAVLGAGFGFGVWPRGSLAALLVVTLPFVLGSLAIGVFVSTLARSSAQAIFITVFFIMPSFVLSGVLLPYQLMPDGVRQLGGLLPLRWYQIGLRRIVARGGGFEEIAVPLLAMTLFFAVMLALIRWRLRPRLG